MANNMAGIKSHKNACLELRLKIFLIIFDQKRITILINNNNFQLLLPL